jgi:FkbM family methyltransferase
MFTFYVFESGAANLPIRFMEPDPDLFRLIDQNVRDNQLDRIAGYEAAIGSADGTATFFVNRTDSMSGSLTDAFVGRHNVAPRDVTVRSLASLAIELSFTRACVKVDVENAEFTFLEGAAGVLDRVAYLIMEVLGPAHAQGFVPALMARSGFHAYYIAGLQLQPSRNGEFTYRPPDYNWLFCRETPGELAERLRGTALTVMPS